MHISDSAAPTSEARERLLSTATAIFYASGIHAVGVERIVAEANVTRATFYRHFPSKEDLIAAYLNGIHQTIRRQVDKATAGDSPAKDILLGIARQISAEIHSPGFRGCAFLNAVAEYPDAGHPVHQTVIAHRDWLLAVITDLFTRAGSTSAAHAGRQYVMLRDGVMAAGCLGDPTPITETFLQAIADLVRQHTPA